jgi:hypothetical protein
MTIWKVESMGRSCYDENYITYSKYFKSKILAEAYVRYMEDKYSDYIDDLMLYEELMEDHTKRGWEDLDFENDKIHEIEYVLELEFGHIIPCYTIYEVDVLERVPMD